MMEIRGESWLPAFMLARQQDLARPSASRCHGSTASRPRSCATIIRVTTQPFRRSTRCGPASPTIIDMIGLGQDCFLFASDYPHHWQFDGATTRYRRICRPAWFSRMCADNPLETFPRLEARRINFR